MSNISQKIWFEVKNKLNVFTSEKDKNSSSYQPASNADHLAWTWVLEQEVDGYPCTYVVLRVGPTRKLVLARDKPSANLFGLSFSYRTHTTSFFGP